MTEDSTGPQAGFASEPEMIQAVFAPLAKHAPGAFGLIDDAALFSLAQGEEAVLTSDMLVAGRHFLEDTDPADIGWKALAVNISDLVAKGAEPDVYLLSIALTQARGRDWLAAFASGLGEAQEAFSCRLAGGDTTVTPGALTISITATGRLPAGTMVRRSGAKPDHAVYVTGTIGDAVAGLELLRGNAKTDKGSDAAYLVRRHRRPDPRPAIAPALRDHASAAMDISDGLAGDFAKLCAASGCGGEIVAGDVPLSEPARTLVGKGAIALETLLSGGDDYCVLAAVPPERCGAFETDIAAAGGNAVRIGRMTGGTAVNILGRDGAPVRLSRSGFDHFAT